MNLTLLPKVLHIPSPTWLIQSITAVIFIILLSLMPTPTYSTTATRATGTSASTAVQSVDPNTVLGCYIRSYEFRVHKPTFTKRSTGETLTCSGLVSVDACWGRCGSSEIGTYEMPYRIFNHKVCTYTSTVSRRVLLSDCEGYPDPYIEVFDAEGCACQTCNSDYTSCEKYD